MFIIAFGFSSFPKFTILWRSSNMPFFVAIYSVAIGVVLILFSLIF